MGIPAARALERDFPARSRETGHVEALARHRADAPARDRRAGLLRLARRCAPEQKGGNSRPLGSEKQAASGGQARFAYFTNDCAEAGVTKAFFESDQYIGVAAGLYEDDPIGRQSGAIECRREQVAPLQTPDDCAALARENAGEENRCCGVVREGTAAGDLVKRAAGNSARRKHAIDRVHAERQAWMPLVALFDPGDTGAQLIKDNGLTHAPDRLGKRRIVPLLFGQCWS